MKSPFLEAILRVVLIVILIVATFIGTSWLYDTLPTQTSEKILHQFGVFSCKFDSFMRQHGGKSPFPTPDDGCEKYIK